MKIEWLSRTLITCMYSYALVINEKQWHKALNQAKVPVGDWPCRWVAPGGASVSIFDNQNVVIVSIDEDEKRSIEQAYAMLTHEAVHIFQEHCRRIGEREPSTEFQAYAVQNIAQRLMESYRDQTKK